LKVAPNDIPLRNNLGLAMVMGGQHAEGIAILQAVAVDPAATATTIRNLRLAEGIAQSASANQAIADASATEGGATPGASQLASTAAIPAEFGSEPEPAFSEPPVETPATAAISSEAPSSAVPAAIPHEPVMLTEALSAPTDTLQMDTSSRPVYLDSDSSSMEENETSEAPESDEHIDSEILADSSVENDSDEPADGNDGEAAQAEESDIEEMSFAGAQSGGTDGSPEALNLTSMPQPVLAPGHEMPAGMSPAPTAEMQNVVTADVSPAKPPMASPAGTQMAALGGDNIYSVQLASYRSANRAQDGWRQIRAKALDLLQDVDPVIRRSDLGPEKGVYFRLRTKPASKDTANQLCTSLQARGMSCLTIKEDPAATEEPAMPTAAKS
jgi:hypothetical protein